MCAEIEEWKESYVNQLAINPEIDIKKVVSKDKLPGQLYKYIGVSTDGTDKFDLDKLESFRNNQLYFSSPLKFNDPYDCQLNTDIKDKIRYAVALIIDKQKQETIKNRADKRFYKKHKAKFEKELNDEIKELEKDMEAEWECLRSEMRICCLSENYDSMLMWSHYTNSYRGFCVGYDFDELHRLFGQSILPALYVDELECLDKYLSNIKNQYAAIRAGVTKSKIWHYEKEWRIICTLNDLTEDRYIKVPTPKSLYLGCNINKDFREKIIDIARNIGMTEIFDIVMEKKRFKITPEPLKGV